MCDNRAHQLKASALDGGRLSIVVRSSKEGRRSLRQGPSLSRLKGYCGNPVLRCGITRAGLIAEMLGWEEDHVANIIRRYVGRRAVTRAIIQAVARSDEGRKST